MPECWSFFKNCAAPLPWSIMVIIVIIRINIIIMVIIMWPLWYYGIIWSLYRSLYVNDSITYRDDLIPVKHYDQTVYLLVTQMEMKWNESGFRPPFCTYRLNWAMGTSWGWWDEWDDTVLHTQDLKFESWRWGRACYLSIMEAPHNTEFYTWMEKKHFLFLSKRRDREPNAEFWRERQRCELLP